MFLEDIMNADVLTALDPAIAAKYKFTFTGMTEETPQTEIAQMQAEVASGALHPMQAKKNLAWAITRDFHSAEEADGAAENWTRQFQQKAIAENIEHVQVEIREVVTADSVALDYAEQHPEKEVSVHLARLLVRLGIVASRTAGEKQVAAGVTIDGEKISDKFWVVLQRPHKFHVKVGRQQRAVTLV